jgi:hypothetical protein
MNVSGYITREEIAKVVNLLLVPPGRLYEGVEVAAATVNGEHENSITLFRAREEIRCILTEARKDAGVDLQSEVD